MPDPKDCLACHKALQERKFVHGPVGVGVCLSCHADETPDPAKHHVFRLTLPQPDLCFSCHDGMKDKVRTAKVSHAAIEMGGCTACHSPHGSDQRFFLKGKTEAQTCGQCHEGKLSGKAVHPPAKASCVLCHNPHGAQERKLLKAPLQKLCLGCHQKRAAEFAGENQHAPLKKDGCVACHNPHSAPKDQLLQIDGKKELCLSCHKKIGEHLRAAKKPHKAVETSGCLACHTPHASSKAPLLRGALVSLCLKCHPAMQPELNAGYKHGPVAQDQCQDCHDPHGSDNPKILKIFFPETFYNSYQPGLYALCFNCHEQDIARDRKTTELTNFRNGDLNLHYLHVHSEKGRSCKACHAVHGGDQEKHVRAGVPFGTWLLPINYKKLPDGGSCNVGCHKPKTYGRTKAAVNQ